MKHVMLAVFLMGLILSGAEPQVMTGRKVYKGKLYSVCVMPGGTLENGRLGQIQFMKYNVFSGDYNVPAGGGREDLKQTRARAVKATWEALPGNCWKIVSTGVIDNKAAQEAVSYRQTTVLEPGKMVIDYELTGKVPMAKQWGIFHNLLALNTTPLLNRDMRWQLKSGREKMVTLNAEPLRKSQGGIRQVRIPYPSAAVTISLSEGSVAQANDCRSWKEQAFRFDIGERVSWSDQPRVFQPGKVWKWSVSIEFASSEG